MTEPEDPPPITLDSTLREVIDYLERRAKLPKVITDCPACGHRVKIYPRHLEPQWIRVMFKMRVKHRAGEEWVYLPADDIRTKAQTEALLRHWGLIEREEEGTAPDGNPRTGFYRLTDFGWRFLKGLEKIPRTVLLFHNRCLGYRDEADVVNVHDVLEDSGFHYNQMMDGDFGEFFNKNPEDPDGTNWTPAP